MFRLTKNSERNFPPKGRENSTRQIMNLQAQTHLRPIIPALRPPPILLIDNAMPSRVASLKSICLELSRSAYCGSNTIPMILLGFSRERLLLSPLFKCGTRSSSNRWQPTAPWLSPMRIACLAFLLSACRKTLQGKKLRR